MNGTVRDINDKIPDYRYKCIQYKLVEKLSQSNAGGTVSKNIEKTVSA